MTEPSLPKFNATVKVKGQLWQLAQASPHKAKISLLPALRQRHESNKTFKCGWYKVTVDIGTTATSNKNFSTSCEHIQLFIQQNNNIQAVNLIRESATRLSLIFFRDSALYDLTLRWQREQFTQDHLFRIKIESITRLSAWLKMTQTISRRAAANNENRLEIYRKTKARMKRWGWHHALRKIVESYQPLLVQQLISTEPYEHWQRMHEVATAEPRVSSAFNKLIVIVHNNNNDIKLLHSSINRCTTLTNVNVEILIDNHQNLLPEQQINKLMANYKSRVSSINTISDTLDNRLTQASFSDHDLIIRIQSGDLLSERFWRDIADAVQPLEKRPDIIYWDHDRVTRSGLRIKPNFKSGWNYDLFFSQNYLGSAYAINGRLITRAAAGDHLWWQRTHWETLLQMLINKPTTSAAQYNQTSHTMQRFNDGVLHIPRVLSHQYVGNKNYSYSETQSERIQARLNEYAKLNGDTIDSIHATQFDGIFQVKYQLPETLPLVSIIVPTRDAIHLIAPCVESVLKHTTYKNYEILIIDNGSQADETHAWFKAITQNKNVRVIPYDKPFNYSAINNFAVEQANGELVCLLNNDTEVINSGWLTAMVRHALRNDVGAVGAKLYYADNTIQHAGVIVGLWGLAGHSHKNYNRYDLGYQARLVCTQNVAAVTAACLVVKKSLYQQVNGLDENNLKVSFNDVDFCLKLLSRGYRNVWTPEAELYHYESKSRGKEDTPEKKSREQQEIAFMREKWTTIIANDPYYSPHLSRTSEDYSITIDTPSVR